MEPPSKGLPYETILFSKERSQGGKLSGGAELGVLVGDELGVFVHEDFARRSEVELAGVVAEIFAVDPGPDEASVGVDVDLGDTELGSREVFVFVHATGVLDRAASSIDPADFILWNAAAAMHDDGHRGHSGGGEVLLDLFDDLEVKALLALELECAVAGADGGGEGVAPAALDKFDGFGGVGQAGVAFFHNHVFFHAAELAEFGFDGEALGVGAIHDAPGCGDVFFKGRMGGVDHDRAVEAGIDAVVAGGFVTVVEMNGVDGLGENLTGGANDRFDHALVRILTRAFGELDNEGSLALKTAAEEAHRLLDVVDVVCPDGVFAEGVFGKFSGGYDHRKARSICGWTGRGKAKCERKRRFADQY